MRENLKKSLARLASTGYQQKYIVLANQKNYVLPEEMLEDAEFFCQMALNEIYRWRLTQQQRDSIDSMINALRSYGNSFSFESEKFDAQKLVHESTDWAFIREQAKNSLATFGIEIDKVRPDLIDTNPSEWFSEAENK